jgi:galactonate dehydratase
MIDTNMNRRSWMKTAALAPLAVPLAGAAPKVTVTGLEIFRMKVNRRGNWIVVRLRTNSGLTGLGDASHGDRDEAGLRHIQQYFEILKGRSVHDIEWFRHTVYPDIEKGGRSAIVAASALEHCLWDLRGKVFGVPTYELFGGRIHQRIRNYANINRSTDPRTPEGFAAMAGRAVEAGFDAVKLAPFDELPKNLTDGAKIEEFTKQGLACAAAVRKTIGPKRDLLIDVHSHYNLERGGGVGRRGAPRHRCWLEEVTPPDPVENLARINREAKMPTAGGESIFGVKGFYPYIAGKAVDIVMPDIKYCGGMWETKKVAAMAEAAGLLVSPHGPASPVGNIAAAHVCATVPNFNILEFSYGEVPWRAELIDPPERLEAGHMVLSERPGFGVELNEATARKYAVS